MAWTRSKTVLVAGLGVLVVAGIVTVYAFRHQIHDRMILADGKRMIARQLATPIDLTSKYGTPASYFAKITSFPAWKTVPIGFQVFDNVPLQIDGMMCLWGEANATQLKIVFPEQILDIPVNQKFETLYVYHGTFFTSPSKTPVYQLVFNYEDGSSITNEILYGENILDWNANIGRKTVQPTSPDSKLAWVGGTFSTGAKRPVCFCLTAIKNPQPTLEVTTIDLYSSKNRRAACILAMTPGRSGLMK